MTSPNFDPNAAAREGSGIFGLPLTESQAALVLIPVPWEATTSYGGGTSEGPQAILAASRQVDLFDLDVDKPYEAGLFMRSESAEIASWNTEAKAAAKPIVEAGGDIGGDVALQKNLARVNELSQKVNAAVKREVASVLASGKIAAIVGGDHSVPYGALEAISEKHAEFGILHFDAHSDTRSAYEGFTWSHASIMHNVLARIPQVKKVVQVGIRDFCEEEVDYCASQGARAEIFFDADLARRKFEGETWAQISRAIVDSLPQKVWISFDIDGLDPQLCPHTGTPVPGGLTFLEATYMIGAVARSGRQIIGFDLNEVAPAPDGESEWDANVGARLLYKMAAWTLMSQGKAQLRKR